MVSINFYKYRRILEKSDFIEYTGKVTKVVGLTIESSGPEVNIGELCLIQTIKSKNTIKAEVVGFRDNKVLLMPLGEMSGIGPGSTVIATGDCLKVG
ncbi:MAG TPA: EscN/YscN/HrcN family type III secretion system ATPase, partial [Clostridia bacterium]|nr:EscN/YscN/HrcN family type III secretion system ATPase [Clostridia bacterium]